LGSQLSTHQTIRGFRLLPVAEFTELFIWAVLPEREMGLHKRGDIVVDGNEIKIKANSLKP
jgi:hypothetical protein